MIIRKSESCPGSPARRATEVGSDSEQDDSDSGALDLSLPLRKRAFDELQPELQRQHSNPKKKIIRRYYCKSPTLLSRIDCCVFLFLFLVPYYDNKLRVAAVPAFLFHFPCKCVRPWDCCCCRPVTHQVVGRNHCALCP